MVDYVSLQRIRPNGYSAPEVRHSRRKTVQYGAHDCRADVVKDRLVTNTQIDAMLSVSSVNGDMLKFHEKTIFIGTADGAPRSKVGFDNKLIYSRGGTGRKPGQLLYPRGLAVDPQTGDIYVADTSNRRVQVYGSPGLLKEMFERDTHKGRFETPVSVAVSPTGRVAIADSKRRLVCSTKWEGARTIRLFLTVKPICVLFQNDDCLLVGCNDGAVRYFDLQTCRETRCCNALTTPTHEEVHRMSLALDSNGLLYAVDGIHAQVHVYDQYCRFVQTLNVSPLNSALSCVPASIAISSHNTLIVADSLNHVVQSYSLPLGKFEKTLLRPTDDLGAVQAACETPEGHLVAVEYSANTPHGMKIFRYLKCKCHNPDDEADADNDQAPPEEQETTS